MQQFFFFVTKKQKQITPAPFFHMNKIYARASVELFFNAFFNSFDPILNILNTTQDNYLGFFSSLLLNYRPLNWRVDAWLVGEVNDSFLCKKTINYL